MFERQPKEKLRHLYSIPVVRESKWRNIMASKPSTILTMLVLTVFSFLMILFFFVAIDPEAPKPNTPPDSYDGVWKSTTNPSMTATIEGEHIEIMWNTDADTAGLYWVGTFSGLGTEIPSVGDPKAMGLSFLGSADEVKIFTYKDGVLSFPFKALGISTTVALTR